MTKKSIKKDIRKYQIISIILYLLVQILSLITPLLMGFVIDEYIPNKEINKIIFGVILFVSIPLISVSLQSLYNYLIIKFGRKKGNDIAIEIMRKMIYQDNSYFDRENSLELLSYSSKEAVGYVNFYINYMSKLYVNVIISVVIFVVLLFLNPYLALIQLLYIPLTIFPVKKMMKNIELEVTQIVTKNAEINQTKGDVFKSIEFIKLNRLEEKKLEEVKNKNNFINKIWGKVAALDTTSGIWSSGFVTVLFTGITFIIGALFIVLETYDLKIGELVSIITYCGLLYSNVNVIIQSNINKKKKDAEYSKLFSYLELNGEIEENTNKKEFKLHNSIDFIDCNFKYNDETIALKNINLTIQKGKWTGIIGKSGSGKSTLLDLITKLYRVTEGQILVDGIDINKIDTFSIREKVTKVTQDIVLFPGTIEDNMKLINAKITEKEIIEVLDFVELNDYINSLPKGIKTDVGEAGKLMSGGEKQRLSIAMGLIRGNKILLLDEVTSALDIKTEEKIVDNLKKLVNEGYTIVSISHKLEFLKYADIIYTISDGEITKVEVNSNGSN